MNAEAPVSGVTPPASPRSLADTGLSVIMMRDILLKSMFRTNQSEVSALSRIICLPVPLVQELVDMSRAQKLLTAMGTMHATAGNEMGYELTDAGKSRALDALSQSEYYGAMPVPLEPLELQRRVDCPRCHAPMDVHPYYGPGNTVIDSCRSCGLVWLDQGEITRIERAPGRR